MQDAMFRSLGVAAAGFSALFVAMASPAATAPVVHTALGGEILGFDVDQNGTEGVLAEYVSLGGGKGDVSLEAIPDEKKRMKTPVTPTPVPAAGLHRQ